MRKPKKKDGPADTTRRTNDVLDVKQETRRYRFLTYVMGGGVKVEAHNKLRDERTPIRVASIRGQLRFWWRACNPRNCKTIEELRTKEAEIWGSAEKPSKVVVKVARQPSAPRHHPVYHYKNVYNEQAQQTVPRLRTIKRADPIAYGAFTLQPSSDAQNEVPPSQPGVLYDYGMEEFELVLRYDQVLTEDIAWALWAWETFGGLGARTRRGFGAIERTDQPSGTLDDIRQKLKTLQSKTYIEGVPSLIGARLSVTSQSSAKPHEAWVYCLEKLQSLRQGENLGRNPGRNESQSPGRSRWPEPEEIRRLTQQRSTRHQKLPKQVDRFPRAAFGLPIIFQFQGGATKLQESSKDPLKTELKPANADRMASPLILRPVVDGQEYRPGAIALRTKMPDQIILKDTGKEKFNKQVQVGLELKHAEQIEPLKLDGRVFTNPLDRFLEEFKK